MINLNRQQQKSLHRKWTQQSQNMSYLAFRRSVQPGPIGCVMVEWSGMWLGIELDGYTHS